jgi:peptide/nickel transport system permease protein
MAVADLIARRLVQSLGALFILSVVIFGLTRMTGDPLQLILPMTATEEDYANARQQLGLDRSLPRQYLTFITSVLQGDLGTSLRSRQPVLDLIGDRLPNSIRLAAFSMAVAITLAFPLGVMAAVKKDCWVDRTAQVIAVLGQSLPTFWVGIILIEVVAGRLQWLPAGEAGGLAHYILPGLTLGWFVVAGMMRLLRAGMLDVLDSDYVKMARVKGVPERRVIWGHAVRNALIPVVTFAGVYFAILITTAIVVETVFAWPGMGRLAYEAIIGRDFPVIQGIVLVTGSIVAAVSLGVDCLYAVMDPRIRHGRS